mmetsp:Transcript_62376/g.165531  ORF Transcript_62376/g.165531 Transcript_62376/m.165531 type:complete len:262 (-) Transcript_62376:758-1543(-)
METLATDTATTLAEVRAGQDPLTRLRHVRHRGMCRWSCDGRCPLESPDLGLSPRDVTVSRQLESQGVSRLASKFRQDGVVVTAGQEHVLISCSDGHVRQGIDCVRRWKEHSDDARGNVLPTCESVGQRDTRCLSLGERRRKGTHDLHGTHGGASMAHHVPWPQASGSTKLWLEHTETLRHESLRETTRRLLAKGGQSRRVGAENRTRLLTSEDETRGAGLQQLRHEIGQTRTDEGESLTGCCHETTPRRRPSLDKAVVALG